MKRLITTLLILVLTGFVLSPSLLADINNPTLNEYVYLGQYYAQVGESEKAIENYEDLIRKHPCTKEAEGAWMNLGDIYVSLLRQKQAALTALSGGIEKTELEGKIRDLRAEKTGLRQKAVTSFQTVVKSFPDSAGLALVRLGRLYAFQSPGQEEEGRTIFRQVMNDFPEEAGRAALFLGDSYLRQGKWEEAKNAYQQAEFFFPEVAVRAQVLVARVDRELKEFSSAVNDLSPVVNILGIDGLFTEYRWKGSIMREAIELSAESMTEEGNPELAIENLKDIIERYPSTNIALATRLYLARLYEGEGNRDQALQELDRVVSGYPKSLYAARASLQKAGILPAEESIAVYEGLRKRYPRSMFWVTATRGLTGRYLEQADKAATDKEKIPLRQRAGALAREIIGKYPCSPQAVQVREFMAANKLK